MFKTLINRLKKKGPSYQHKRLQELWRSKRFFGVQIHQCGCRASSRYAGKFFLFNKVPSLPVAGCDTEECPCVYLGVADRRCGLDRRVHFLIDIREKRQKMFDRRKGMDVWKGANR